MNQRKSLKELNLLDKFLFDEAGVTRIDRIVEVYGT